MGLLTDFFLATEEEVQLCNEHLEIEDHRLPRLQYKRIDTMSLDQLENILLNRAFSVDAFVKKDDANFVRAFDEEGPWILRVSPVLMDALRTLASNRIEEVAATWANTEEFKRDRMTAEGLAEVLRELIAFIHEADVQHRYLYLWICL